MKDALGFEVVEAPATDALGFNIVGEASQAPPTDELGFRIVEKPGYVSDMGTRAMRGLGVGAGQTISGAQRIMAAANRPLGPVSGPSPVLSQADRLAVEEEIQANRAYQLGSELTAAARARYQPDPANDEGLFPKIVEAGAQMVPTVALGLVPMAGAVLASAQYGAASAEQGAEEALAAGRPDLAQTAAALYAPMGAFSEGLLGGAVRVTRLGKVAERWIKYPFLARVTEGAVREGVQEPLEQLGQNLVARSTFDPDRALTEGLAESAMVAAPLGAIFGAGGHVLAPRRPGAPETVQVGAPVDPVTTPVEERDLVLETPSDPEVPADPTDPALRPTESPDEPTDTGLLPTEATREPAPEAVDWQTVGRVPESEPVAGEGPQAFEIRQQRMRATRALAEAAGVEAPDVRWAPDLRAPDGRPVEAWVEPDTGRVVLNAAAEAFTIPGRAEAVVREERAHQLLRSEAGQQAIRAWVAERLRPEDVARLQGQGYARAPWMSDAQYDAFLANEAIAKAARANLPWWRELVERVRAWMHQASGGRISLTNDQAARAILRSLRKAEGAERPAPETAPGPQPALATAPEGSTLPVDRAASPSDPSGSQPAVKPSEPPGSISTLAAEAQDQGIPVADDGGLNIRQFSLRHPEPWEEAALLGNKTLRALYSERELRRWAGGMRATRAIFGPDFAQVPEEVAGTKPIRSNSDPLFGHTFDLTTVCPRQDQYLAILGALERERGQLYTPYQRFQIGLMMQDAGVMPACWYCYGQAGRDAFDAQVGAATAAANALLEASANGRVAPAQLDAAMGTWKSPGLRQAMVDIVAALGPKGERLDPVRIRDIARGQLASGNPREQQAAEQLRAWAQGATKANKPKGYAPYSGQVRAMPKRAIEAYNRAAGFRLNSQTDLRPWHVIDTAQFLMDLGGAGGMAHVYTRVVEFARIFGRTGLKLNLSTEVTDPVDLPGAARQGRLTRAEFRALHARHGDPMWNDMNGTPQAEALALRRNPDIGTMLVATSEYQLWWGLESPVIDMIIPYHRGAVPKEVEAHLGVKDFSREQHEHWGKVDQGVEHTVPMSDGTTVRLVPKKVNGEFRQIITREHHHNNRQRYLELCRRLGITPRFERFKDHPNYMRLVRDVAKPNAQRPVDASKVDWQAAQAWINQWLEQGGTDADLKADPSTLRYVRERIAAGEWPQPGARQMSLGEPPEGMETRRFAEQVDASPGVTDGVRAQLGERVFYEPRKNETDAALAARIIQEAGGPEAAIERWGQRGTMPESVRGFLGQLIIKQLGVMERTSAASNPQESERLSSVAAAFITDRILPETTSVGQFIQSFAAFAGLTPAGMVKTYRRTVGQATDKVRDRMRGPLNRIRQGLQEINQQGLQDLAGDRQAQEATTEAVNEAVPATPAVRRAVRRKAIGVVTTRTEVKALMAELRDALRDAGITLEELVRHHYELLGDGVTLERRVLDRLGIPREQAERVSAVLDRALREEVARIDEGIRKRRLAQARRRREPEASRLQRMAASGVVDPEAASEAELDDALRTELRRMRSGLAQVLREHWTSYGQTGQALAGRLTEWLGLRTEVAERLAAKLERRFQVLLAERRRREILRHQAALPRRYRKKLPIDRIGELANLGLLNDEAIWNATREALGLPGYSPRLAAEITRRANAMVDLPEGFARDEAAIGILRLIARESGLSVGDLAMSYWYANTLSGPFTHVVNSLNNMGQVVAHGGLAALRGPRGIPLLLDAMADGFRAGMGEAGQVLRTGMVTGSRAGRKLSVGGPLEALDTDAFWKRLLGKWKYVARALAAEDMLFYKPAEAARVAVLARGVAREEGLRGQALERRAREIVFGTGDQRAAAEAQAAREGFTGAHARRRVREILEQARPEAVREGGREAALRTIYNDEPYGVLGALAKSAKYLLRLLPAGRLVIPFVDVVANVSNESLNYFPPVGFLRAGTGQLAGTLNGRTLDLGTEAGRQDLFDQYAKAALGTGVTLLLAVLAAQYLDDEDPAFMVYGQGPGDAGKTALLRARGWRPWTIKVGDRYVSYADTPLAVTLGVLGTYLDGLRWKELGEQGAVNQVAAVLMAAPRVTLQRSFLKGVQDLMVGLSRESAPDKGAQRVLRGVSGVAGGFVAPNALRQVDRLLDPTVTDSRTASGLILSQLPVARRLGRPALNALGEPVSASPMDRLGTQDAGSALVRVLTEKAAWVSTPEQGDLTEDEYYRLVRERGALLREVLEPSVGELREMAPELAQRYVDRVVARVGRQVKGRILMERE